MKLAIMQPYFFPYIGYFQLIDSVDKFIVYDNLKYTKKGWIKHNHILVNGKTAVLSLSIKKDSDFLDIRDRELSEDFRSEKLLNQLRGAYRRAPYFTQTLPLIERVLNCGERNLFKYLHHSLIRTCEHLAITTRFTISSEIPINHELRNQDKVIAFCEELGADTYINPIGGRDLYSADEFRKRGITLKFLHSKPLVYPQPGVVFTPDLSIIDVMMFNPLAIVRDWIANNYEWV